MSVDIPVTGRYILLNMNTYTIGEVSKLVEIPTKTIRFYEESGVLAKPERLENGYRVYTTNNVEELKILKYTRDLGLPLSEMKKLIKGCEGCECEHSHEYVESLITKYTDHLSAKIKEMETLKVELNKLNKNLRKNCKSDEVYCCNILHQLVKGGERNGR